MDLAILLLSKVADRDSVVDMAYIADLSKAASRRDRTIEPAKVIEWLVEGEFISRIGSSSILPLGEYTFVVGPREIQRIDRGELTLPQMTREQRAEGMPDLEIDTARTLERFRELFTE